MQVTFGTTPLVTVFDPAPSLGRRTFSVTVEPVDAALPPAGDCVSTIQFCGSMTTRSRPVLSASLIARNPAPDRACSAADSRMPVTVGTVAFTGAADEASNRHPAVRLTAIASTATATTRDLNIGSAFTVAWPGQPLLGSAGATWTPRRPRVPAADATNHAPAEPEDERPDRRLSDARSRVRLR